MPPKHSSLPLYFPDRTIVILCSLVYRNTFWIDFRVQNTAARLTVKASKSDHLTPILHSLHWLPVAARIQYKVSSFGYSSLSDSGPEYLSRVLRIYTPSSQLRSSSGNRIFCVPSIKTKTFGQRSFSYAGSVIWNKLPYDIRRSQSKTSLKQALKIHLFITHY